jgi:hypothetical protein
VVSVITANDNAVVCDKCGANSVPDEETARREHWGIDTSVSPSPAVHLCPICLERAARRR